jgi:hypothetical protein
MYTSHRLIKFDTDGICIHCKDAKVDWINVWFPNDNGKKRLKEIADEIIEFGKSKGYGSIIDISGL